MFIPGHAPENEGQEKCYVPVSQGQVLCSDAEGWRPIAGNIWRFANPQLDAETHYIGCYFEQDCYVVMLDELPDVHEHSWLNLYQLLGLLSEIDYEVAARAVQIVNWERDHQFCGRCGSPTQSHDRELAKRCEPCDMLFYPRLSPCVITVITRGEECLLAHNPAFPSRFFSALAGFIEVGETIESALRREVAEEVGIKVGKLEYFGSQSWPFPGQLMIGFLAEYDSGDIVVDGIEIEEADWFRFDELPMIPPATSLAGRLIREFVKRNEGQ